MTPSLTTTGLSLISWSDRPPSAAYLLSFRFVLRLQLLTGHVAAEASLDLGGGPVGFGIIQGDVHDILLLLGPAAILLLRRPNHRGFSQKGTLKRICASLVPSWRTEKGHARLLISLLKEKNNFLPLRPGSI